LRYIPSIPSFVRAFIMKGCWILLKAFSASIEMIDRSSLFLFVCYITFNDLHMLNHPCIPGINPAWSWGMIFLICCWIRYAIILLLLHLCSLQNLARNFCCCCVLLCFRDKCNTGFIEWVRQYSSHFHFWKTLRSVGTSSSLKVW
jgi:hypothetical protein